MTHRLLLLSIALLSASPALAWEDVAPLDSAVVTTSLRTLRGCPRKHVISSAEDYARVVDGLAGAPATPDFAVADVLLLVTDEVGGAGNHVIGVEADGQGTLRLILERRQPELYERGDPLLTCFFFVVPRGVQGLRLEVRTSLGEGGFVQRPVPSAPADHDPARLPRLGPDLRLSWACPPGGPPPPVELRLESTFPDRPELPARATGYAFDGQTLGLRFPRIRDGVRHLYAAHAPGLRSVNPLVLRELPDGDGSGSPAPVVHRFELEPIPGGDR